MHGNIMTALSKTKRKQLDFKFRFFSPWPRASCPGLAFRIMASEERKGERDVWWLWSFEMDWARKQQLVAAPKQPLAKVTDSNDKVINDSKTKSMAPQELSAKV